jgi:AraC family transcriptional regulator
LCTELPSKSAARDHSAPAEAAAEWKALETVHTRAQAHVRLASVGSAWKGIAVSRFRLGRNDVCLPPLAVPAFGVSYGAPAQLERTLNGLRVSGTVTPGRLAILPPDVGTRWVFDRTGDVALVYLSRAVLDQAIEDGADRDPRLIEIVPRFLIRDLVLERVAHQLLREVAEARPEGSLAAEALAQDLASHLLAAHSNLSAPPRRSHAVAPRRLKRAVDFMHANLGRPVSLQEIASAAGMSVFHFAHGFREAMGRPPHRYLVELRLSHARTLLHDAGLPIGEVARAVGFTHSHFTAVFTRHMGMTPTTFRDVLRR